MSSKRKILIGEDIKEIDNSKRKSAKNIVYREMVVLNGALDKFEDEIKSPVHWKKIGVINWKFLE